MPTRTQRGNRSARSGVWVSGSDSTIFGIGYGGHVRYVRHKAFDMLKMDRSFAIGAGVDTGTTAMLEAVLGLAKALEVDVVAKGDRDGGFRRLTFAGSDATSGRGSSWPALLPSSAFSSVAPRYDRRRRVATCDRRGPGMHSRDHPKRRHRSSSGRRGRGARGADRVHPSGTMMLAGPGGVGDESGATQG